MDDTIIDMRDIFLKKKIENLKGRDQELLNEISITLKIIMDDVDLHLDKDDHNRKQKKLRTVQRCCNEIDEFIKGNRL